MIMKPGAKQKRSILKAALLGLAVGGLTASVQAQQAEPDGYAGATAYEEPAVSANFETTYESQLLKNTYQLVTDGARSGEGYFSADGGRFVYQAEMPGNPFYQIYLMDLESGDTNMVSTGIGLTTCSWIHRPTRTPMRWPSKRKKLPFERVVKIGPMAGTMILTTTSMSPTVMAATWSILLM
jgi:hypothetical protein